eukprot:TRINITY_DN6683_c0_g1_i1.p1 TRINITY_DN6683_c0_g1~~TRINITY_DN6683_c0_g1_i1.p1  ORF type:complete len:264 (-),score=75.54 TRINITY_DN6683_c0_g1_i1:53-844(-)
MEGDQSDNGREGEEQTQVENDKPQQPAWRRLKKSPEERFDEPFVFEIGGRNVKIQQDDIGYGHNLAVGLTVWDGALVLAKYLELRKSLKGLRIIELGSGTGIAGICAAALGGDVVLTDVSWLVNFLKANIALPENKQAIEEAGGSISVSELYWRSNEESAIVAIKDSEIPDPYDVDMIIAADVIYTEEAVPMLLTTLYNLSSGKEKEILLAGEHHNPGSYQRFFQLVGDFFEIKEIEPQYHHPDYCIHPQVQMWSLKRKPPKV